MKKIKKMFAILLVLILSTNNIIVFSMEKTSFDNIVEETARYLYSAEKKLQVGSVGGEWAVIGLARSGYDVGDEYYQKYYEAVEKYVADCKGVLHEKKYTEYSRVILALTAIGRDPAEVAGYNLLLPLGDYKKAQWQGINGPIWALIALDSGNYEIPDNPDAEVQATRGMYIEKILEQQLSDGGWALNTAAAVSDADITGMALQALAKYKEREDVESAIEKALECVSNMQQDDGGFSSWGTENSESCVQMIVALCELGIQIDDARFVKNGHTMVDSLMNYYQGEGIFSHTDGNGSDVMATEQAFYALVAIKRQQENKNSLYRMSDHISVAEVTDDEMIVNGDTKNNKKTFDDIKGHKNALAIEALASYGIINGKSEHIFEPESTMTRAEFATIMVRGLGLEATKNKIFDDVSEGEWYYEFISTAYDNGIVNGVSESKFNPNGTITRQEAAVMVARGADICGIKMQMNNMYVRDTLAGFIDYVKTDEWARESLAFCYSNGILSDDELEILPYNAVTRAEVAQMLYNMLENAGRI